VVVLKIYPDKNDGKADAKNKNKEIDFSNKLIIRFLVVGSMKIPRLVLITRYEGDFFFPFLLVKIFCDQLSCMKLFLFSS
jgi:hypothetical protein